MDPTASSQPGRTPGQMLAALRLILAPEGERVLTQARLAKRLGLSLDYVQKLEVGRKPLLMRHIEDLAQLRPVEARAQEFAALLAELRAAVVARLESKLSQEESERDTAVDPVDIAAAVAAQLPRLDMEALAASIVNKLPERDKADVKVDALSDKLDTVASTLRATLDAFAATTRRELDSANAKLDQLQATLNHTDAKLDVLDARVERGEARRGKDKRKLLRAVKGAGGLAVLGAAAGLLLVLGAMMARPGRSQSLGAPVVAHAPEVVNITQPVINVTNMAQGSLPFVFDLDVLLGAVAGQMGKRVPPERYVPNRLMPGQKLPPCEARMGEQAINGGCWTKIDTKPPCELLFRLGDGCYRPVAADPQQPVMETPQTPEQESR